MPYATALASVEDGRLAIISQNALRFANRVAYDDSYGGLALEPEEGERLAGRMGNCNILFMANHGVTVTGVSVGRAFDDLYFLERACMVQVLAMSTGRKMLELGPEVVRHTVQQMVSDTTVYPNAHFEALKRMLAREAPEFRA
jgi:ribulose-5-phosphate 4-epimerase/fuculose-1-phosphate aldolase